MHEEDKRETTWASANSFWYAVQVVAVAPPSPALVSRPALAHVPAAQPHTRLWQQSLACGEGGALLCNARRSFPNSVQMPQRRMLIIIR